MAEVSEALARVERQWERIREAAGVHDAVGEAVQGFGGYLRCETCRREEPLGSPGRRIAGGQGWPKCCGYTMRWWTQRQIDAGEVPV